MQHCKENLLELCLNGCISIKLLKPKIYISHLFRAECRFTLKSVRAMIITYSYSSVKRAMNQKSEIFLTKKDFITCSKLNSGVLRSDQIMSILLTKNKHRSCSLLFMPNII